MTAPFTRADLQQFIEIHHIEATILPMNGHTPTVSDAARELNVPTEQIIKSLVFLNAGTPPAGGQQRPLPRRPPPTGGLSRGGP